MARLTSRAVLSLAAVSATATAAVALMTPAAGLAAPANDNYYVNTSASCVSGKAGDGPYSGYLRFVDYGPGAKGGGDNDDYFVLSDNCADSQGVKAWAWIDGKAVGDRYLGSGDGSSVVWDPLGNVKDGQNVGMKICQVDGNADPTPDWCQSVTITLHE